METTDAVEQDRIKDLIGQAFALVERPGNWAFRESGEGDEPYLDPAQYVVHSGFRLVGW